MIERATYWIRRAWVRLSNALLGGLDRIAGLPAAAREAGGASVEFVILVPAFLMIFISSFEASMMLTRQVMMERAVHIVVRDIRLDTGSTVSQNQVRNRVCERATILPDCQQNMLIELSFIDQTTYDMPAADTPCVNQLTSIVPQSSFVSGRSGRMVMIRACYSVQPSLPLTVLAGNRTLGSYLVNEDDGTFRIVTASAFVVEEN
ncbi:TadE/TadG family type IV pilus assembly protein [Jannaschia donghaensis]|uniref:TadE-like protein n=1 Tax=Jannaschia donghaensis TaxID=420998 RepID=A0A0M6YI09_9RHOB|nr:TadE family protein [Jannaschia donghaensis]CTQ49998.1 TadE-like protein [Jannaschia donghaensis]